MRSSSIGSPLLNAMREGEFRSYQADCWCITTSKAFPVLKEIAPRALLEAMTRASVFQATVSVFLSPATSGGFLVKTTFLTSGGLGQSKELTEYFWAQDCHLSQIRSLCRPVAKSLVQLYRVWTLPAIMKLGARVKQEPSFDGLALVPCLE